MLFKCKNRLRNGDELNSPLIREERRHARAVIEEELVETFDSSSFLIKCQFLFTILKLTAGFSILKFSKTNTEEPIERFVVACLVLDILNTSIQLLKRCEFEGITKKIIGGFQMIIFVWDLNRTYITWQISGNIWLYSCDNCFEKAYFLSVFTLALLIIGYIEICIPCILLVCFCCCLPFLLFSMGFLREQTPVSEEVLEKLVVEGWENETEEGCVICSENYQEGDMLIKLGCEHYFHEVCIKRWLRVSGVCPLCRAPVI